MRRILNRERVNLRQRDVLSRVPVRPRRYDQGDAERYVLGAMRMARILDDKRMDLRQDNITGSVGVCPACDREVPSEPKRYVLGTVSVRSSLYR